MSSRRAILRASTLGIAGLAGCSLLSTAEQLQPSKLAASASVIAEPSEAHPLRLQTQLRNDHDFEIELMPRGNPKPLLFTSLDGLMVIPIEERSVSLSKPLKDEPVNGCWRAVTESGNLSRGVLTLDMRRPVTMAPGDTYSVRYRVYHDSLNNPCWPDRTYKTELTPGLGRPDESKNPVRLVYTLTASDDGSFLFRVDGPTETTLPS